MTPESVGAPGTDLVLGKHSGRHAFNDRLEILGFNLSKEESNAAFDYFKVLCDKKKTVSDGDIEAFLLDRVLQSTPERRYELKDYAVTIASGGKPTASITLAHKDGEITEAATGNGPVNAAYNAIKKILGFNPELREFRIQATSQTSEALGEGHVILSYKDVQAQGRGASTDVIEATIRAYVDAVNRLYVAAAAKEVTINGTNTR